MWYFQIQFKSHHLLTTLLTSSPIPSCSMFSNAAPLTSRAVVAVDIPHFILADHDLDVVVSIISLKKKFQFLIIFICLQLHVPVDAIASARPSVQIRPPRLGRDLGNARPPPEVHGRAVRQHRDCGVSPDVVSDKSRRQFSEKIHYRMLINLSLVTWSASPPHP